MRALHSRQWPISPIGYGQARDHFLIRYGRLPEGRGVQAFGSTLADYIFMEISVRADTCWDDAHYKVIDNRLGTSWACMPSPPRHPRPPVPPAGHRSREKPDGQLLRCLRRIVLARGRNPCARRSLLYFHRPRPGRVRTVVGPRKEELYGIPARSPRPQVLEVRCRPCWAWLRVRERPA